MISLITSLIGGIQGRSAVSDAQRAMETSADAAGDIYGQHAGEANQTIDAAALSAIARALGVSEDVAAQILSQSEAGAMTIDSATGRAVDGVRGAAVSANAGLQPYVQGGSEAMTTLSSMLSRGPGAVDLEADPGYQFRLEEGAKALERSAAARGGVLGGAAVKSMARFSQGLASQEYDNAWKRSRSDFDRTTSGMNTLAGLGLTASVNSGDNTMEAERTAGTLSLTGATTSAGVRQQGVNTAGQVRTDASRFAGEMDWRKGSAIAESLLSVGRVKADTKLQRGQATAAGHMGRANAWNGMLDSIGRTGDDMLSGGLSGATGFNTRRAFGGR